MARLPRGRDRSGPRPGYNWLYTCVSHEMWVQRPLLSPDRGAAPRRYLGVPAGMDAILDSGHPLPTQK
jgi:hypothetical protein